MARKIITAILTICFVFGSVGMAFAVEKGNKRKGKYVYRKVYKACNARGEAPKPKPHLNPDAKTMDQWTRLFDKQQFEEFGCQEEWSALSDSDLSDIYAYLHAHAADSPTPLKCK